MGHTSSRLFFLVVAFPLMLSAQSDSVSAISSKKSTATGKASRFTLGIIAGPNLLNFNNKYQQMVMEVGISGGLDVHFTSGKHSAIAINLMWERKTYSYNTFYGKRTYDLNTVTLPIMVRRGFGKKNIFNLNVGIFFSNQYSTFNRSAYYDKLSEFNLGYAGAVAGLGARIPLGNKSILSVEVRDHIGLTTLYNSQYQNNAVQDRAHFSNTINLLVGISYVFAEKKDSAKRKAFFKPFGAAKMSYRKKPSENTTVLTAANTPYYTYRYNSDADIPKSCTEGGFLIEFPISEQLNINTGVSYEQRDFSTEKTEITFHSSSSWGTVTRVYSDELNYTYQFISVPVFVNYVKKIRRSSVYGGTGIEVKKLTYSSAGMAHEYSNIYSSATKEMIFACFYELHAGTSLRLSDEIAFFIEPNIEFGINKFSVPGTKLDMQLWSYGCRAGLKF